MLPMIRHCDKLPTFYYWWDMAKVDVVCRYCHKTEEVKGHGKGRTGHPRYHCYSCRRTFQPFLGHI
ncbi:IS1 family transposase [Xenorhabdus khoisanae]|uniref:IS1 family transposase n=1 Tax=Xenorhabdus khoisanae TaxID=880157 RepID=UPI000907EBA3